VLTMIGKKPARKMMTILESSPSPNQRISKGISATLGVA